MGGQVVAQVVQRGDLVEDLRDDRRQHGPTDGAAIAEQVRGDVADLRALLVNAQQQVQQTDPDSAAGLGRALVSGTNLVGALLKGAQVAGTINRDPVLHDAYERSPACARLQRSGATVPPGPTPTR